MRGMLQFIEWLTQCIAGVLLVTFSLFLFAFLNCSEPLYYFTYSFPFISSFLYTNFGQVNTRKYNTILPLSSLRQGCQTCLSSWVRSVVWGWSTDLIWPIDLYLCAWSSACSTRPGCSGMLVSKLCLWCSPELAPASTVAQDLAPATATCSMRPVGHSMCQWSRTGDWIMGLLRPHVWYTWLRV